MKERPILFSAPMVRALLEGRKTQTRRIVTVPRWASLDGLTLANFDDEPDQFGEFVTGDWGPCPRGFGCPYGKPGDRLWVREAWTSGYQDGAFGTICRADKVFIQGKRQHEKGPHFHAKEIGDHIRWRPSIHMPRWASRITLEITEVRVQRLQEISNSDAAEEGAPQDVFFKLPLNSDWDFAKGAFCHLWGSINGPDSWKFNPWVWAASFKVVV